MITIPRRTRSGSAQDAFRMPKSQKQSSNVPPLEVISLSFRSSIQQVSQPNSSRQVFTPAATTSTAAATALVSAGGDLTASNSANPSVEASQIMPPIEQQVPPDIPIIVSDSRASSPARKEQSAPTPSNIMFSLFKNEGLIATALNSSNPKIATADLPHSLSSPKLTEIQELNNESRYENNPALKAYVNDVLINASAEEENIFVAKKIKMLEENAKFFEAKAHPLFVENSQLKGYLVQANEYIRERTRKFSTLLQPKNLSNGASRDLIQKLGNFDGIFTCLREDIDFFLARVKELELDKANNEAYIAQQSNAIKNQKEQAVHELKAIEQKNQEKVQEYVATIDTKQDQLDRFRELLDEEIGLRNRMVEELSQKLNHVTSELLTTQAQNSKTEIERQKYINALLTRINNMVESQAREKKEMVHKYEQSLSNQRILLNNQIDMLKKETEEKLREQIEEIERKRQMIVELSEAHKKEADEYKVQIHSLRVQVSDQLKSIKGLEKEVGDQKGEVQQLRTQNQLIQQNNIELYEKQRAMSEQIEVANQQLENEISSKEDKFGDHLQQIKDLEAQIKEQQTAWQKKHNDGLASRETALKRAFKAEKDSLENAIIVQKKEVERLNEKVQSVTTDFKVRNVKLEDEKLVLQKTLDTTNKEWTHRVAEVEKYLKKQLEEEKVRSDQRARGLEQAKDDAVKLIEQKRLKHAEEQMRMFGDKMSEVIASKEKAIKDMKATMETTLEETGRKFKHEYNQLETNKDLKILELETDLRRNMNEMKAYHALETEEFKKSYDDQIRRLKIQLESNTRGLLNDIRAQHMKEVEGIKTQLTGKITALDKEWKDNMTKTVDDYETRLADVRFRCKGLEKDLAREGENAKKSIADLQETIAMLRMKVIELEMELAKVNAELAELKIEHQGLNKVHDETKVRHAKDKQVMIDNYMKEEQELLSRHASELKQVFLDQVQVIEAMKLESVELKFQQKKRCEKLIGQYHELEKLFNERPSRSEDLNKIRALEREVVGFKQNLSSVEGKMKQANTVVKYLQIELENCKVTYDIFGPNKGGDEDDKEKAGAAANALTKAEEKAAAALYTGTPNTPRSQQQAKRGKSMLRSSFNSTAYIGEESAAFGTQQGESFQSSQQQLQMSQIRKGTTARSSRPDTRTSSPLSPNRAFKKEEKSDGSIENSRQISGGFFEGKSSHQLSPENSENIIHSGLFKRRANRNMSQYLINKIVDSGDIVGSSGSGGTVAEKTVKKDGVAFCIENSLLPNYFEADLPLSNQQIVASRSRMASRNRISETQVLDAAINGASGNGGGGGIRDSLLEQNAAS